MASVNQAADWIARNASEVATRISGSQWAKHVLPGFQALQAEAGQKAATKINANVRINGVIHGAMDVGGIMGRTLANARGEDATELSGKIADRIKREATDTSADDIIDTLFREYQEDYSKIFADETDLNKAKSALKESFKDRLSMPGANQKTTVNAQEAYASLNAFQKGQALGGAYFNTADKDAKFARMATAAGVYMGAATVGRVMNGGTLTQDSYGRKDLVGIPFI